MLVELEGVPRSSGETAACPPQPPPLASPCTAITAAVYRSPRPLPPPQGRNPRAEAQAGASRNLHPGGAGRALLGRYQYADAVQRLSKLTSEQAEIWAENPLPEQELLREAIAKQNRLEELQRSIQPLYANHKYHDPRLAVWVRRLLELKPDDEEMLELRDILPPPNEAPTNPKAGEVFILRIGVPEPEHPPGSHDRHHSDDRVQTSPGEIIKIQIPPVHRGPKRGTPTTLTWKAVPTRPNPHK